jgi:outer membrane protein OmpA-like peptidoglycan-associated protein/flagellar hook assembly protein FlgD
MKRVWIFLLLIIFAINVYADVLPGSEFFNSHIFAHDQAIGGSTSANIETASSILVNPSTGSFLKQLAITTSLGGLTSLGTYGLLGISYPTLIGTFSGQVLYYGIPSKGVFGGTFAFSKDVADDLGVGFGLTATSGVSVGLNLGFVYKVKEDLNPGLGIKKLIWGGSLLNLGLPIVISNYSPFPSLPTIRSGVDLMFLRTDPVKFNFVGDVVLGAWGLNAEINGGLSANILDILVLKGGGFFGVNRYGYGFGATLKYTLERQWGIERLDIRLHYSYNNVLYSSSGASGSGHWVGFDFALGTIDSAPPKINIDIDVSKNNEIDLDLSKNIKFLYFASSAEKVVYISPNYDGRKDKVKINLNIAENGILKEWKLIVKDAKGNEVKVISSKLRREFSLDFEELLRRLFAPKKSVDVPREISWDGTDAKGKVVSDGEYFLQVYAKDFEGNEAYSPVFKVIVDNTPPSGSVSVPYYIFSPNGDGNKDDITFTLKDLTKGDEWIAYIEDVSGNVVKTWNLGTDPVDSITWGGLGDDGKLLPDGNYNFVLRGEDKAGNIFITSIKGIIISTKLRNLFVKSDIYEISPNNDGYLDKANINIIIDDTNGLQKLNVYVKDTKNDKVMRQWNFEGNKILTNVYWDGTDNSGNVVWDGVYVVYADAEYIDGNKPVSPPIQIKVDATPPQTKISFSPPLFSPDADGVNDEVVFTFNVSDDSEIDEWSFKILTPDGKRVFKEFKGRGAVPSEITWDGVGDNGDTVDSAEEYPLVFEVKDKLGNKSVIRPAVLPTDILVEVTPYGYKIRVHSIEFAFGSAEVTPKGLAIIKRVAEKLKKFRGYKIRVEGHTDNVGSYDYNLKLSKARAESVMRELIKLGIDKDRISAEGFAFDRPIAPNDTEEGRAKNRRVEFLLIRD